MKNKFSFPSPSDILEEIIRFQNMIIKLKLNLSDILDHENENFQDYSRLMEIILSQMHDSCVNLDRELDIFCNDFPNLSFSEWEKFNEKWNKFIDDLKLDE